MGHVKNEKSECCKENECCEESECLENKEYSEKWEKWKWEVTSAESDNSEKVKTRE